MAEFTSTVDLWGQPWTAARDPRGRKSHRRTPLVAEKVAVLVAAGLTQEEVAAQVFLSEPTLRKYYFRELADGPNQARAVLMETLWKKARAGSASHARLVLAEFDKADSRAPATRQPAEPKPVRLGKKAAADAAADTAQDGTGWSELLH